MTKIGATSIFSSVIEILNEKTLTSLDNFVSQEIEYWDPSTGKTIGIGELDKKLVAFWIDHPKCVITIDVIVGKKDLVVAELSFPGYEVDEEKSLIFSTVVCTLDSDKITKIKNYFDPHS
jgi:predicted ester cyclase